MRGDCMKGQAAIVVPGAVETTLNVEFHHVIGRHV
jgi:hypothetical protein